MAEIWDLYTRLGDTLEFKKTGQTIVQGQRLPVGTFHYVVHVWIKNDIGEYLISQRNAVTNDPLYWEPAGSSVLARETSEQAAIRVVKEKLGLELQPASGTLLLRGVRRFDGCDDFVDVW